MNKAISFSLIILLCMQLPSIALGQYSCTITGESNIHVCCCGENQNGRQASLCEFREKCFPNIELNLAGVKSSTCCDLSFETKATIQNRANNRLVINESIIKFPATNGQFNKFFVWLVEHQQHPILKNYPIRTISVPAFIQFSSLLM